MEVHPNATKRGHSDAQLNFAVRHAVAGTLQTIDGQVRQLLIGSTPDGEMLELVIADPFTPDAILVHAMPARPRLIP